MRKNFDGPPYDADYFEHWCRQWRRIARMWELWAYCFALTTVVAIVIAVFAIAEGGGR